MKIRILAMVLLTGFISMSSYAGFQQFGDPQGYMNVFNTDGFDPAGQGGFQFGSGWSLNDLQAISAAGALTNRQFTLLPNINTYADNVGGATNDVAYWTNSEDGGNTPGLDGNKWMEALCYYERTLTGFETTNVFTFTVSDFTLSNRYDAVGYIRVFNADYSSNITDYSDPITSNGTYSITNTSNLGTAGYHVQAGWIMNGVNANPATDWGSVKVTATQLDSLDGDETPPSPVPEIASIAAISDSQIIMSSSTVTDNFSNVEYIFSNTVTAATSGWTSSTNWTDIGLTEDTPYFYRVKARDTSALQNETAWSAIAEATTFSLDTNAPLPEQMYFESTEASPLSIKLTATTATDPETGVEYFFDCVAGDGVDSGWQSSPIYINTGLVSSSNSTWRVQARDLSGNANTNMWSDNVVVTTLPLPGSFAMSNSLQNYIGDSNQDGTVHEVLKDNLEFADYLFDRRIAFDSEGADFGSFTGGDNGRNVIRTMGTDYSDSSFEAYVSASGMTADENIFIGLGPGDLGAYGVPDWSPNGETTHASFIGQITKTFAEIWSQTNNSTGNWATDVNVPHTISTGTVQRIKLAFDFGAQTGTITIDLDYDGVTFDEDSVIGPISIPDFSVSASRIYLGGDDGIILSDFEIVGAAAPVIPPADLVISAGSGSVQLMWTGVAGQTYNVEYKNDLTDPTWTADTTAGTDIPGEVNMSATSTAPGDAVFYQIKSE